MYAAPAVKSKLTRVVHGKAQPFSTSPRNALPQLQLEVATFQYQVQATDQPALSPGLSRIFREKSPTYQSVEPPTNTHRDTHRHTHTWGTTQPSTYDTIASPPLTSAKKINKGF